MKTNPIILAIVQLEKGLEVTLLSSQITLRIKETKSAKK